MKSSIGWVHNNENKLVKDKNDLFVSEENKKTVDSVIAMGRESVKK